MSSCVSTSFFSPFFFLMIRRPPRSTLFPYTTPSDLSDKDLLAAHRVFTAMITAMSTFEDELADGPAKPSAEDRKSTRLNSSHVSISYAVFCLKKKKAR